MFLNDTAKEDENNDALMQKKGAQLQEEIDAEWDGDLGFEINMGGEKFNTKMKYDNQDKFQVQSILDYYSDHDIKAPMRDSELVHPNTGKNY